MYVSVSQSGGLFDTQTVTELVDDVARVVDGGEVTVERKLDNDVRERLATLVARCAEAGTLTGPAEHAETTDSLETTLRIDDGGTDWQIVYVSGDDVPAEVTDLVDAVLETPYRDPGTRWSKRV